MGVPFEEIDRIMRKRSPPAVAQSAQRGSRNGPPGQLNDCSPLKRSLQGMV